MAKNGNCKFSKNKEAIIEKYECYYIRGNYTEEGNDLLKMEKKHANSRDEKIFSNGEDVKKERTSYLQLAKRIFTRL